MAEPIAFPKFYYTRVPTRQYDPNFQNIYILGRRMLVDGLTGSSIDNLVLTFSGSLIKFAVHMSSYIDGEYWNLSGSDFILCENIYTKTVPESLTFEIGRYFDSGSSITFDFYNSGSGKSIWLNYYFAK